MNAALIEARGLSKTYGSRFPRRDLHEALVDVSFDVRPGEIFAFLGPNGAGKTTTINLLLGFLGPTRGTARLFGHEPTDRRARMRLGYLPEHYAFYPFLKGPALLDYFGRLCGIESAERRRRADELLERLGLSDARNRPLGKYSRGMRQRLGIAQALLNRPELLILDEPTSGFDPVGRRMVRDLLMELKRDGASIFLSSHILSEVESICDRVVIVNHGRIVRQGTLDEVAGRSDGFEIVFRDPDARAEGALRAAGFAPARAAESVTVIPVAEADAQRAVDTGRSAGGTLTGYRASVRTLEDVFIEDVTGAAGKATTMPEARA